MALDPRAQAALAVHRFGLGPRKGGLGRIGNAREALLAELDNAAAGKIAADDLVSSAEAARELFDFRQERKAARQMARAEQDSKGKRDAPARMEDEAPPKVGRLYPGHDGCAAEERAQAARPAAAALSRR